MLRAEIAVGRLEKERDRQRKEIEALKLELKIRLHAANSLLHGVEGERDRQKEELAHWKEANEQLLGACRSRDALLAAVEKERDQANARRSSHAKARDKWAKDHARQKKEIEALKLELKIRLHAANSLLHGVEGERDEARAELAAGGVVPRSKEQIVALAAKEERGRAREVRLVYPIVATRSNDGREWVRVVTKEGGDE